MSVYGDLAYFLIRLCFRIWYSRVHYSRYRVDQELASHANPVVFCRCIVEEGEKNRTTFVSALTGPVD